jgi:putative tryptophan/tyrosine transport system substrate-binding protein
MRRREFIAALGGAASWPLAARAQQPKSYRIGGLLLTNADVHTLRTEIREALAKAGFVEGQNITFDFRSAEGKIDLLPGLAAELVSIKVDVIVAVYTPCALAAQRATHDIPIVVLTGDPIGTGLISSLARPGGNVTGVSLMAPELHGKCVELLRDMLPSIRHIAFLGNAADPSWKEIQEQVQVAGKGIGLEITPTIVVGGIGEIGPAFAAIEKAGADAAVLQGSLATKSVAELALKHRLAVASVPRSFAEVGGLISYGPFGPDAFRHSATFVIKILRGNKPEDIPVEQPTKFELVINLKSAKALGLSVSDAFLLRADEVIE